MSPAARPSRPLRLIILAICAGLWITAFVMTHVPVQRMPQIHVSDRLLHALGYFGLAGALWLTLWSRGMGGRDRPRWILATMMIYAAFDEATQELVGRTADVVDWMVDLCGAVVALGFCETLLRRALRKLTRK